MKSYALCLALFLSIHQNSIGEIINGYLYKKYALQNELVQSSYLLAKSTSKKQQKLITNKLKRLKKKLKLIEEKYLETEQLLNEIRSIDLELFYEVSNLKNAEGTTTNVYVRYTQLTEKESPFYYGPLPEVQAFTVVRSSINHENICISRYGSNTVTIIIGKNCNPHIALAHEFGHVLYLVPNLKAYTDFLNKSNRRWKYKFRYGHSPSDPSWELLELIEVNFKSKYDEYMRSKINATIKSLDLF